MPTFGVNALFQNAPDTLGFLHIFEAEPEGTDLHDWTFWSPKRRLRRKRKKVRKLVRKAKETLKKIPEVPELQGNLAVAEVKEIASEIKAVIGQIQFQADQIRKHQKLSQLVSEHEERLLIAGADILNAQERLARERLNLIANIIEELEEDSLLIMLLLS